MTDVTIYKGNFGEVITWTLYQYDGVTPFNLNNYAVTFKVWKASDSSHPIVSAAATIISAPAGTVSYTTQAADFTQVGTYVAAFTATANGVSVTFTAFILQVLDNA